MDNLCSEVKRNHANNNLFKLHFDCDYSNNVTIQYLRKKWSYNTEFSVHNDIYIFVQMKLMNIYVSIVEKHVYCKYPKNFYILLIMLGKSKSLI